MAQEEKKQNLEERIEIAEMRSKLSDAKQHVTVKKLVYEQDNNVRENFRKATIKPPGLVNGRPPPPTPRPKRKSENLLEHDKNFKMRPFDEYEDDENDESSDEDDEINLDRISFDTYTEMSETKGDRWTLKSGEKVKDLLTRMTSKKIEKAKEIK